MSVDVFNLHDARFECTFGRGCAGICCRNGRPPVYDDEIERITQHLPALLPLMRPQAATVVAAAGFMTRREKADTHTARVVDGWCVFFNGGCVLQKYGADEGDKYRYKPFACSTFPLEKHHKHGWYVRQAGVLNEIWDLPCLRPEGQPPAAASLTEELQLIRDQASGLRRQAT